METGHKSVWIFQQRKIVHIVSNEGCRSQFLFLEEKCFFQIFDVCFICFLNREREQNFCVFVDLKMVMWSVLT